MATTLRLAGLAVAAIVLIRIVGLFLAGDPVTPAAVEPVPVPSEPRVDSDRFDDWLPALREGADVTFSGRSTADDELTPPTPIRATATLGPLVGEDLESCVRTMERISRRQFEELQALPPVAEPGTSYELLQQAYLLCGGEEYLAAARALRDGDYFVTAPGPLPPGPPNAGIVQTTARQNGQPVIVSIILPHDKHRRFADAYHYKRDLWLAYPAHAVDQWNRQSEAWRRAGADRLAHSVPRTDTDADREWRRRYAPGGTVVDPQTALLSLVP
ncbi:MAG: hypothetical protein KDE27_31805 [Planctomycetes bacterium]|nr:hypothetical protein [Planctomycetota bacterium]